jgi:putative thioredoxin
MMAAQNIINVTEANFDYEVIQYSQNLPVVVDFWAEWCVPCKMLDPILRQLANERAGDFRLAKVNVDENQNLAMRFNVRGIPAVKAFRGGNIVAEFTGVQSESKIRKFLEEIIPTSLNLNLDKANSYLESENWDEAEAVFRQVIEERPGHPEALIGLTKALLAQGRGPEARDILNHFPVSSEFQAAKKLKPLSKVLSGLDNNLPASETAVEATYAHALRLIRIGNLPAAMDGILDVLRTDKDFRQGEAKAVILALFEILGPKNPMTRQYQTELASVLF